MSQPSRVLNYLLIIVGGACLLSGILFVYMILGKLGIIWTPYTCLTDILGQASTPAGRYFETSGTSCSGVGKGPYEISVFASRIRRGKKALIFKYEAMDDGSRDAEPVIVPTDDGAVRISVKHVAAIICQSRHWDTLAVTYDVGRVVDFPGGPWPECPAD
jgi:hypothetical protein